MATAVSPREVAERLTEHWLPRVVGEVDDSYVKVARLSGTFGWQAHDEEARCSSCCGAACASRWRPAPWRYKQCRNAGLTPSNF